MIISAIQPKQPINPAREQRAVDLNTAYPAAAWYHPALKLGVISAVEVPEKAIGPEYHISISKGGSNGTARRCSAEEARLVLKQFGVEAALEDNHSPITRNFWLPLTQENADRAKVMK